MKNNNVLNVRGLHNPDIVSEYVKNYQKEKSIPYFIVSNSQCFEDWDYYLNHVPQPMHGDAVLSSDGSTVVGLINLR